MLNVDESLPDMTKQHSDPANNQVSSPPTSDSKPSKMAAAKSPTRPGLGERKKALMNLKTVIKKALNDCKLTI